MGNYYQYNRKHFEYDLKGILIRNKVGFLEDITEEWQKENYTWEIIYAVKTKNKSVDIIIFSSIDINTNFVRDIGSDAVKVVMRWQTKNGPVYKKVAHHYRLKTLFDNLENTLIQANSNIFNLNFKEFSKEVA